LALGWCQVEHRPHGAADRRQHRGTPHRPSIVPHRIATAHTTAAPRRGMAPRLRCLLRPPRSTKPTINKLLGRSLRKLSGGSSAVIEVGSWLCQGRAIAPTGATDRRQRRGTPHRPSIVPHRVATAHANLGGRLAPMCTWSFIMRLYRGPGLGNFGRDFGAIFEHGEGRFVCKTQGN
jgi:hypothetical protein